MPTPKIYPVVHHLDSSTSLSEVALVRDLGADGVFLISHTGDDDDLVQVAREAKRRQPGFPVGINLLSFSATNAALEAVAAGVDMLWADDMGVDSTGLNATGRHMSGVAAAHPELLLFASLAFKYRPFEADPVRAAVNALHAGFVPTTSGAGTGQAPDVEKIRSMGKAVPLAVASGITPDNVSQFAPHLAHMLVATGISRTPHHIDPAKLLALIASASGNCP